MNQIVRIIKYLLVFLFASLFFLRAFKILDPDFGWHLRMGEVITQTGIPKNDPFSYTMTSFPFIDHEWLTNVLIYLIYGRIGFVGISIVSILIFFVTVYIVFRSKENYYLTLYLVFAFLGLLFPYFAVRPQIVSWFLFAVFIKLLFDKNEKRINLNRFLMVFLSIVWVNLHGSFAILVVVYSIYLFAKTIRLRKLQIGEFILFLILIVSTFINPYGINIWREVLMQITDSKLRYTISEWTPLIFRFDWNFILYFSLFVCFLYKYRSKIFIERIAVVLFLLIQSLMSQRHLPLFVISSIPLVYEAVSFFNIEINKKKASRQRAKQVSKYLKVFVLVYGVLVLIGSGLDLRNSISKIIYPEKSLDYLSKQEIRGNVLSEYSWGGYLIWKMPQRKVFIDGRMPSWRWIQNPSNEEGNAMESYLKIFKSDEYKYYFDKYNIEWLLLSKNKSMSEIDNGQYIKKISEMLCGIWNIYECSNNWNFIEKIKEDGWREVYRDEVAVIYKRDIIWDK